MAKRRPSGNCARKPAAVSVPATRDSFAGKSRLLAFALILVAALLAYHNSFTGPFIFDDQDSILKNPTIRHLWPVWQALSPPSKGGITVEGRPIVNLSLAINYAQGGTDLRGYHVLNLIIHILAGLTLLGIMRRTLLQPVLRERLREVAWPLALVIALIWTVHPLQTESVTYVVQRAESIMGLFYLLTLYCFVRGAESPRPGLWYCLAVLACALGMASKEVMLSAPLVVLLYDRRFLSGSIREALRRRWPVYLGLAASWVVLGYLVASTGKIQTGLGITQKGGVGWRDYFLTEPGVILHYLWLSVWPHPLCFDYQGWPLARTWTSVLPGGLVIIVLLGATGWALRRNSALGLAGAWFFLILAPTSSVLPTDSPAYEHRMYLPLAAVVAVVVTGGYEGLAFLARRMHIQESRRRYVAYGAVGVIVVMLGFSTVRRNSDYASELAIWQDVVNKRPNNPRAHNNLGLVLSETGRIEEGIAHIEQALRLKPKLVEGHFNLGRALVKAGRLPEAVTQFNDALQIKSDFAEAYCSLGYVSILKGNPTEAIRYLEQSLRIKPELAETHENLGNALAQTGKMPGAAAQWEQSLQINPDNADVHNNLAIVLAQSGKTKDAIRHWEQALRLKSDFAEAHNNLGYCLSQTARIREAIQHFEWALQLKPDYVEAKRNLAEAQTALQASR